MTKMNKLIKKIKENLQFFLKDPFFLRYWEDSWRVRKRSDNQLSASINSYWYKRRPYTYKGDAHMFVEDMYAGIMPFMHYRGEREKYPVRTTPQIYRKQERMLVREYQEENILFFLGMLCVILLEILPIPC